MSFLKTGVNNRPLKKQDDRKLKFSEFGIIKQSEPEKPDRSKSLEIAKRLSRGREELDHEALIRNFGTVIQPEPKEPGGASEIKKGFRGKNELDCEALIKNFGR